MQCPIDITNYFTHYTAIKDNTKLQYNKKYQNSTTIMIKQTSKILEKKEDYVATIKIVNLQYT